MYPYEWRIEQGDRDRSTFEYFQIQNAENSYDFQGLFRVHPLYRQLTTVIELQFERIVAERLGLGFKFWYTHF
jgi:hypothetical protein